MWFYLALLSAFFNGLSNVARRTHGSLAQPAELSWWTVVFSLPLTIGLVVIDHGQRWTGGSFLWSVILSAVISTLAGVFQFRAYKYGDASSVSPIANFLPVFMVITSFLLFGTLPSLLGFTGIIIAVAGVYYSSVSGKHQLVHPLRQVFKNKGSRAMLIWALLISVSTALIQPALKSATPAIIMLIQQLVSFTLLSVYLLCRPATVKMRTKRGEKVIRRWGWHIAAISIFATLAVLFQYQAMHTKEASYVLAVKRLDVLFTVLLAGLFLRERHIMQRFKGSVLAIVGVIIILFAR